MTKDKTIIILGYDMENNKKYVIDIATKKIYSNKISMMNKTSIISAVITLVGITAYPALAIWLDLQIQGGFNNIMKQLLLLFGVIISVISFLVSKKYMPSSLTLESYLAKYCLVREVSDPIKKKDALMKGNQTMFVLGIFLVISLIASIATSITFFNTSRLIYYFWVIICFVLLGVSASMYRYLVHLYQIKKYFQEIVEKGERENS